MKKLEKWTGEKMYMYPNGDIATPQQINRDFPAALTFPHVIETDEGGEVCFAVMNLSVLKSNYKIDKSLTEEEAIQAIEDSMNMPMETEPTPEERIAAAMEFNNMVMLSNIE